MARVASSVASPLTISSSGITATGLKKWKPTTRSGCSRSAAISVIDSDEVFVARTHSGDTTASTSAKTGFLTFISSNTASITKSASAKTSPLSAAPETRALSRLALSGETRPFAEQLVDLGVHVAHALVDARLVEVGEHDGHPEPAYEQQRELAGHQAGADDADLGDRTGQRLVGCAGGPLRPLLHQVEGVQAGASAPGSSIRSASASSSAAKPSSRVAVAGRRR